MKRSGHRPLPHLAGALCSLAALCLAGCAEKGEPGLVARVASQEITLERFSDYVDELPAGLKSRKQGAEAHLEHLQSLIDKELLVLEARRRTLQQDREYLRKLERERDRRVLALYFDREIRTQVKVDEPELRAYFATSGRDREVQVRFMAFASEEDALRARGQLRRQAKTLQPAPVETPAALRSLEGSFRGLDALPPAMRQPLASMQVGEASEPIPYRDTYLLFQLVETRPADFASHRDLLSLKLSQEKMEKRRRDLVERLRAEYAPRLRAEGLRRFAEEAATALSAEHIDPGIVVCEYAGGQLTSGRLVDQIKNQRRARLNVQDSSAVAAFIDKEVLPEELMLAEALRLGLHAEVEPEVERQAERLLVDELILRQIKAPVQVTYEEARAYFEENPQTFSGPEYLQVQEILVASREQALDLRAQLERGADPDALAASHTLRPGGREREGLFHFHHFEAPLYGGLVEAAWNAPLHQLQGPVKLEEGYALFWVLERGRRTPTFEDKKVQFAVKNVLTRIKQNENFDAFVASLREKYHSEVKIYPENLPQPG